MNRREKNSAKLRKLAVTGILCGVMLFLAMTDIAVISIGPANMSFCCVPIVIGTLVCGLDTGMILSAIFGISSVWKAFSAPSALVMPLMGASPVYVIIMSLGARLLIPIIVWSINKAMSRFPRTSAFISSAAGSLTNTVCYLGLMLLFYVMAGLDSSTVIGVIAGVGALNGSLEALACLIVCPPVVFAVSKVYHNKKGAGVASDQ